jgi:hypothetical protein
VNVRQKTLRGKLDALPPGETSGGGLSLVIGMGVEVLHNEYLYPITGISSEGI